MVNQNFDYFIQLVFFESWFTLRFFMGWKGLGLLDRKNQNNHLYAQEIHSNFYTSYDVCIMEGVKIPTTQKND